MVLGEMGIILGVVSSIFSGERETREYLGSLLGCMLNARSGVR